MRHALDDPCGSRSDLFAHRATFDDDLAATFEDVVLKHVRFALRRHRLGPGLDDVDLPVEAVLRPLHVHRLLIVRFNRHRVVGQLEDVVIGETESLPVRLRRRNISRSRSGLAFEEDHLHGLVAEQSAKDRPVPQRKRRLMNVELIGIDRPLDDVFAEPVGAGDKHDVAKSGLRVKGEHDPR